MAESNLNFEILGPLPINQSATHHSDMLETNMNGAREKITDMKSLKLVSSNRNTGSKQNPSLKIKNGKRTSHTKEDKPKSKSPSGTVASALLERTRTDFANRNHVNRTSLLRTLGTNFSRRRSSFKGEKGDSLISSMQKVEDANSDCRTRKLRKRKQQKRRRENVELDEASRLQRRARYLLIKLKLEQNLIDAYLGEGWKGQSREKIRPEKELQRAKKQILKCKLGIRDAVRQLDSLSSVGRIEASMMSPDGSVYHEHIFCAKCKLREAFQDNDIILCDGTCNRAFHQECHDPPLATEHIPPADQGWLCRFCDCKMEILEATNAHLGTHFSVNSNWQDIFKEEAALPAGGSVLLNPEDEWPSDDSEDDDYDPARNENSHSCSVAGTEDHASDDMSSFSSLSWSLEEKAFGGSDRLANICGDFIPSGDSDDILDNDIINGRRRRGAVDYKKLYDEMFGKDELAIEQVSEDEDWGPRKKKRIGRESDAASILMTLFESENRSPNEDSVEVQKKLPEESRDKKSSFRIPPSAVEKLRCVFSENELPSKAVKEKLSRQLGLELEKVNKWFKNARYIALKIRKREKRHRSDPKTCKDLRAEDGGPDLMAKNDDSPTLKDLKKIHQGKHPKSYISSSVKKKHKEASLGSPTNDKKAILEFSDDLNLKEQLNRLKEKINKKKKKKRVELKSRVTQEAEKEMERLCQMKSRLEQLKLMLPSIQKEKPNELDEQSVIFVPTAELKEKAQYCAIS